MTGSGGMSSDEREVREKPARRLRGRRLRPHLCLCGDRRRFCAPSQHGCHPGGLSFICEMIRTGKDQEANRHQGSVSVPLSAQPPICPSIQFKKAEGKFLIGSCVLSACVTLTSSYRRACCCGHVKRVALKPPRKGGVMVSRLPCKAVTRAACVAGRFPSLHWIDGSWGKKSSPSPPEPLMSSTMFST